jgi:two-component system, OmpR family, sensor histidine kinase VicK
MDHQTIFQERKDIHLLLNSVGDGIFVVDQHGHIDMVNQAAIDLLQTSEEALIDQDCLKPLGATDEQGHIITKKNAALLSSIRNGKKTVNAIRQFTKHTGEKFWASITTTPILKDKQVIGGVIVFRDITKQKLNEEHETEFAHVASHQLRTPLGNIQWAIEYFLSGSIGKLNKKQTDYLQTIYQQLKDMNRLVNDLLSISRIQNNKVKPLTQPIDVKKVTKKVIADVDFYARASNVEIKLTDKAKTPKIKADLQQFRTVIQNLIENAIRYSFPHTTVHIVITKEKKKVTISVTNSGIGIGPKDREYIFAKFFRTKEAIDKIGDGTGLGLYITKSLTELNKGEIWFESEVNKTTTFYTRFIEG